MMRCSNWIWLLLLVGLVLYNSFALHLDGNAGGTINYSYGDLEFKDTLSEEEVKAAVRILDGKIPYPDNPSCGYTEKISITIDGLTFALACDGCEDVEICETGKYVYIDSEGREILEEMFTSRGGTFPCV